MLMIATLYSLFLLSPNATYPQDAFTPPMDIPMYLSGTFGELRSNHFHSGIDIKTQGREGIPILAIKEGYVSRLRVSPTGFGHAVYVTHPNGYTSVYAHLQKFEGEIGKYARQIQFVNQSFSFDVYPEKGRLSVTQGQVLALSGNTGGSGGAHLHFEIRDTRTEHPLNPLLFGFDIKDNIRPVIQRLAFYDLESGERLAVKPVTYAKSGGYTLPEQTLPVRQLGVAVGTFDRLNDASNQNGVYAIRLEVDAEPHFAYQMDRFSFDQTRYLNAHVDYDFRQTSRGWLARCHKEPGNFLDIYRLDKGAIALNPGQRRSLRLVVSDVAGNESEVLFSVVGGTKPDAPGAPPRANPARELRAEGFVMHLKPNTLYRDVPTPVTKVKQGRFSGHYQVHDETTPMHHYCEVHMDAEMPAPYQAKAVLVRTPKSGSRKSEGGSWNGQGVTAKVRDFGYFYVDVDSLPPVIRPINFHRSQTNTGLSTLVFAAEDALSGIDDYNAYLDGNWALTSYDAKRDRFEVELEAEGPARERKVKIAITDRVGNTATLETRVVR